MVKMFKSVFVVLSLAFAVMVSQVAMAEHSVTTIATWKATAVKSSGDTTHQEQGVVVDGKMASENALREAGYKQKQFIVHETGQSYLVKENGAMELVNVEIPRKVTKYYWNE